MDLKLEHRRSCRRYLINRYMKRDDVHGMEIHSGWNKDVEKTKPVSKSS